MGSVHPGQGPTYIIHAFLFSVFSSILTCRPLRKLERPPFLVLIPRESKQLKMTTLSQANHPIFKAHTLNFLLYIVFTLWAHYPPALITPGSGTRKAETVPNP